MTAEEDGDAPSGSGLTLWVLQLGVAVLGAGFFVMLLPMGQGRCAPSCDYALLRVSIWAFIAVAVALVAVAGLTLLVLRVRMRGSASGFWWIPFLGLVMTVLAAAIAYIVGDFAMR